MRDSHSDFVRLRELTVHVRRWEPRDAGTATPTVWLLHGWMDVSASFQFVVDALAGQCRVLAPDARGFGLSDWPVAAGHASHYAFQDYLADLDQLVAHYSPREPIALVGHSMGANVALHYAGVRPARVRRVVALEGFGVGDQPASRAPARLAEWLDQRAQPHAWRTYPSFDALADRLLRDNPRLGAERARLLARQRGVRVGDIVTPRGDPAHRAHAGRPYRLDETLAVWGAVTAPVLLVEGRDSGTLRQLAGDVPEPAFRQRFEALRERRQQWIEDAGHMVHLDQPEAVAASIRAFLLAEDGGGQR
ncbi:alpha/beta fold hydrolase [Chitinasiproducens palmae]|uniref:Lysophospholipase, alpha-beta hydrolase superfamily n=1 Tax=Chitinasiproducens palmae TaxID=1770053 RepID=A0A1H2PS02_9BURK|nr:alpha/beta hydrolase [Chitinasiproducens palmae]SDV49298.1 Lysophospholipase, alpha-beta hydrolase superfamily [Chitinasiproducens palmae]